MTRTWWNKPLRWRSDVVEFKVEMIFRRDRGWPFDVATRTDDRQHVARPGLRGDIMNGRQGTNDQTHAVIPIMELFWTRQLVLSKLPDAQ